MPDETAVVVRSTDKLRSWCRRWKRRGAFAFDTEFVRDETYHAVLGLVQVADEQDVVLIDPLAKLSLEPFWALVADPATLTIVHAGKEDFELCLTQSGRTPRNVFDTQIAAGFVGLDYPMSLARLVPALLHKRLGAAQTLTDWQRRPLTPEQLRYAVEDVRYLPQLHRVLAERLQRSGRTAWAAEEFARYEDPDLYARPVEDRLLRCKGARSLDRAGLAVLRRLLEWRDAWAQRRNRPPRALVRDDLLVQIARLRPTQRSQLEILRGFPGGRHPRIAAEVLRVIREALAEDPDSWPTAPPRQHDDPMVRVVLDVLSAYLRSVCHEQGVSHDLVGSTQRLRELLNYHRQPGNQRPTLLTGWRSAFVGRQLIELLEGRIGLHLAGWPDQLRLEVVRRSTHRSRPDNSARRGHP